LFRFAQYLNVGPIGDWAIWMGFADVADISDWASEAAMWVTMKGIITGQPGNLFDPTGNATRAEVATMLMRFIENTK
jgi:hypothetical protein